MPSLETNNIPQVVDILLRYDLFDGLYLRKSRFACSVLGQNIDISFVPNGAPGSTARLVVMVQSAGSITLFFQKLDGLIQF